MDVVIEGGDRVTRDQQDSPRLDLWVLNVDTALDSTTGGLSTDGAHHAEGREDGL